MPVGRKREKVLYGLGRKRGSVHRYTWIRWGVGVLATVGVVLLPALDVLRFDLWGGRHVWLGEQMSFQEVAKAFAFPFLAINIAIILASRLAGRYLCGFVCPIGSLSRLFEWFRFENHRGHMRFLALFGGLALCALLVVTTFSFWIDWRVFAEGSPAWIGASAVALVGGTVVLWEGLRRLGLRFCRDYCPSGVYFAVLGPKSSFGVEFAHPDACTDCHACEATCPMDLMPREMSGGAYREGRGFYPEAMSNFALCIRCGDCVAACEGTTARNQTPTPLRLGFLPPDARDDQPPDEGAAAADTAQTEPSAEREASERAGAA
jgi:polyferredoxin